MSIGIIILAAGNSSRMGSPKQLLPYQGHTLLQHTLQAAAATSFGPIVLVLGAYAEEILAKNIALTESIVINAHWELGISSSIVTGMSKMLELAPETTAVIIAVSDQPYINANVFEALAQQHNTTGKNIIASNYAQTMGTPVLFNKEYFEELLLLEGNTGAKPLLQKYAENIVTVAFELGSIDIDTQTDYQNLTLKQ